MDVLTSPIPFRSRPAHSHIETINVDTGEIRHIKEYDYCVEAPNWLADGRLLFNALGRIRTIDLTTLEERELDTGYCVRVNNDHVVSADGKMLAVSHHAAEDMRSRIYTMPIEGGSPRLITPIAPSYLHGISPDGKTLAYCAERNSEYDIYTIPVEGGVETQLTNAPGLNDGPEYSPCGQYIWFNSVRAGNMQIFRMRADGSEQTQMLKSERNDWFPHVSPDGKRVVYVSYGTDVAPGDHPADKNVELRVMDADGKNDRLLLALFGGQGTLNVNSWSPDSRTIAYVRYEKLTD